MKAFTKTLMATGLGLFGSIGVVEAGQPYGNTPQSIAAGGCYGAGFPDWSRTNGYSSNVKYHPVPSYGGSAYDPSAPIRIPYDDDDFSMMSSPANDLSRSSERWDGVCGYVARNQRPFLSLDDRYDSRYEEQLDRRFDDLYDSRNEDFQYRDQVNPAPQFEPWRPANASFRSDRRNW